MDMGSAGRKPLGQLLVEVQGLDPRAVEGALQKQRTQGGRLGDWLVKDGVLSRRDVIKALARQHDLAFVSLHIDMPHPDALELISAADARTWRVVPVSIRDRNGSPYLVVAMGEPQNQAHVPAIARHVKMPVQAALCDPDELQESLDWYEGLRWKTARERTDEDGPRFLTGILELGDPHIKSLVERDLVEAGLSEESLLEELPSDELQELMEPSLEEMLDAQAAPPPPVSDDTDTLRARVEQLEWELSNVKRAAQDERDRFEHRLAAVEARLAEMMGVQKTPEEGVPLQTSSWDDSDGLLDEQPTPVPSGDRTSPFAELIAEASGLRTAPPPAPRR